MFGNNNNENILKGFSNADDIIKGKRANIGEIREWKGQKYKKMVDGWVRVSDGKKVPLDSKDKFDLREGLQNKTSKMKNTPQAADMYETRRDLLESNSFYAKEREELKNNGKLSERMNEIINNKSNTKQKVLDLFKSGFTGVEIVNGLETTISTVVDYSLEAIKELDTSRIRNERQKNSVDSWKSGKKGIEQKTETNSKVEDKSGKSFDELYKLYSKAADERDTSAMAGLGNALYEAYAKENNTTIDKIQSKSFEELKEERDNKNKPNKKEESKNDKKQFDPQLIREFEGTYKEYLKEKKAGHRGSTDNDYHDEILYLYASAYDLDIDSPEMEDLTPEDAYKKLMNDYKGASDNKQKESKENNTITNKNTSNNVVKFKNKDGEERQLTQQQLKMFDYSYEQYEKQKNEEGRRGSTDNDFHDEVLFAFADAYGYDFDSEMIQNLTPEKAYRILKKDTTQKNIQKSLIFTSIKNII